MIRLKVVSTERRFGVAPKPVIRAARNMGRFGLSADLRRAIW
ncbi:hypothetical protein RB2083_3153 [Rhodobacteraceae bacterium HTCC2083]|nr:hypothetical protein RB2083_3153 [Rhodobacteraceae bacterium HTCC2083]